MIRKIDFAEDLLPSLEAEAARLGLSLSQYINLRLRFPDGVGWCFPGDPTSESWRSGRDVPGFVYLFRHTRENHLYKIGFSSRPDQRRREVERTEDCSVEVIATIPTSDMRRLEADLHREHARKRIRGEWFQLSEFDVDAIRRLAERQS